jgi:hypothetical protein
MRISFRRILFALVVCAIFTVPGVSQNAQPLIDAPFTATITTYHAGQAVSTALIARASNGSVYYGSNGHDGPASIEDVPNQRRIEFLRFPPEVHDHTYRVSPYKVTAESVEQYRKGLRCAEEKWRDNPDKVKANRPYHYIPLGEKNSDGMMLVGVRVEETFPDGTKRISEHWDSDLGITTIRTSEGPQEGKQTSWIVSDIRREEPDPSLFQIPEEYLSDPLLDAKTVFIDNQTGMPEVGDKAADAFDRWKSFPRPRYMKVVKEKSASDLTATFTKVWLNDLPIDQADKATGIKLQIYQRGSSEPIFEQVKPSSGTTNSDTFATFDCVLALLNRIANARVGEWPPRKANDLRATATRD